MLREYPKLKRSPIKEVVVGISVELSMEDIDVLGQELVTDYPIKKEIKISSIEGNERGIQSINEDVNGYIFQTEDGAIKVFVEKNRIAYSVVREYSDFDELKKKYMKIINTLQDKIQPFKGIGEIGLRYINKIDSISNMELFNIKLTFDQNSVAPFFARFEKYENDVRSIIVVVENKLEDKVFDIILDIDSHTQISKLDDIEKALNKMREVKNKIFFSSFDNSIIKTWE